MKIFSAGHSMACSAKSCRAEIEKKRRRKKECHSGSSDGCVDRWLLLDRKHLIDLCDGVSRINMNVSVNSNRSEHWQMRLDSYCTFISRESQIC
ncbi:hypothetical protein MPTK1_4g10970 [Marchantia polymorpha subsp. ruderalis]|uniref:Uncharacterized protein n=2 Tax=Marchantia polymorpha TaxID=3197 RepID=A0AAF6B8N0_MARPO|nr:hypothetical protein MARPO_0011s0082 [Marchantia polymorpha]BBN08364.1 hypothetical protein Mp_4g10970 [Marchantia polymorpha subsp. ruderalis]|eukprot:PTQ46400.1 hypothetical protein MARPO_0011s0082 [Marchantia polymorpha]